MIQEKFVATMLHVKCMGVAVCGVVESGGCKVSVLRCVGVTVFRSCNVLEL